MDINGKVTLLNKASLEFKDAISIISSIYKDNTDIQTCIWKVNKAVNQLQSLICKNLEETTVREEFDKIIKTFDEPKE